jgi:hypothetical protein
MARKIYECTNCKKTFTRRANADRHNIAIHNEMAVIYNKETVGVSNKRKINMPSPSSSPSSSSTISLDIDNNNNNTINIPKPNNFNLKDFEYRDPYSKIAKTDEEKVFKIFEKISPLIDELDTLLISTYIQNINRTQILASVIISSLTSQNPVKSIKNHINFYRSFIGIKKASGFVALSQNIPPDKAQSMLATIILTAPYSKNKFDK